MLRRHHRTFRLPAKYPSVSFRSSQEYTRISRRHRIDDRYPVAYVELRLLRSKTSDQVTQSHRRKLCTGLTTTYLPSLPALPPLQRKLPRASYTLYKYWPYKPADLWSNPSSPWYHQHSGYGQSPPDVSPSDVTFPMANST